MWTLSFHFATLSWIPPIVDGVRFSGQELEHIKINTVAIVIGAQGKLDI